MTDLHTECLQSLCRVCGNKLKKSKDQWKSNYRCEDYREMLREKFDLETEKDDASIHPLRLGQHEALGTYSLVGWLLIRLKERETAAKAEIEKQGDRESQCDKQGELGLERERDKLTYPSIGYYLQGHTQMDRQTWLQGLQGTETDRQTGMVARYRDR